MAGRSVGQWASGPVGQWVRRDEGGRSRRSRRSGRAARVAARMRHGRAAATDRRARTHGGGTTAHTPGASISTSPIRPLAHSPTRRPMPRAGLDRDTIIAAAAAIADAEGLGGVTIARLAAHFGVRPPSLYNHVAGLDAIRRELTLRGLRELHDALAAAEVRRGGRRRFGGYPGQRLPRLRPRPTRPLRRRPRSRRPARRRRGPGRQRRDLRAGRRRARPLRPQAATPWSTLSGASAASSTVSSSSKRTAASASRSTSTRVFGAASASTRRGWGVMNDESCRSPRCGDREATTTA